MLARKNFGQEELLLFARAVINQQRPHHDNAVVIGARAAMAFNFVRENNLLRR